MDKEAGAPTGIGLQIDDEGRAGNVVLVAYVNDDSLFAGQVKPNDEVLEVNGVPVKGDAKAAAAALVAASPVSITVRPCAITARTATHHHPLSPHEPQIQTPSQMLGVMTMGKGKKR